LRSRLVLATFAIAAAIAARADEPTATVFAAGSLRVPLEAAATEFRTNTAAGVRLVFGPSATLRARLEKGERADVFAAANMEHPRALAAAGRSGPARVFAGNHLCALAPASLDVTPDNLLARMLDPAVKLATSTPKVDPSGDYAWQVFERAEKVRRGAYETLSRKALKLVGGGRTPAVPAGRTPYSVLVEEGRADIFLTYCTHAEHARREVPSLQVTALPGDLAVATEYGLVVMNDATAAGQAFADFLLGPQGERILAETGFAR
jgi:molybdate transport system substrate-binding protein